MTHSLNLAMASVTLTALVASFGGSPSPAVPAAAATRTVGIASAQAETVRTVRIIAIDGRFGAGRAATLR